MLASAPGIVAASATGVTAAAGSTRRRRPGGPGGECGSPRSVGSAVTRSRSCGTSVGSSGVALARGRTVGKGCTVWTFFAVSATVCTGRRRNSDTSATTTGVTAALMSVPVPQIREAPNAAAADATLAMINVCSETPRPRRLSCRSVSGSEGATTFSLSRRTLEGRRCRLRVLATSCCSTRCLEGPPSRIAPRAARSYIRTSAATS